MRKDEARQARIHDRLLVAVVALTKLGDPLSPDPPATLAEAQAIARDALRRIMED
jgi:hypothetical protein